MEIVDVETIPVEVPVKPIEEDFGLTPYVSGPRLAGIPESLDYEEALERVEESTDAASKLLVRIETDDGVTGWSEIMTHAASMRVGQVMFEDVISDHLLGKSVSDINALFAEFPRYPTSYYRDVTPFLGCAELAMWDAFGKTLGQPVHQVLGGKDRDEIPVSFCLGLLSIEESREKARFAKEQGFDVLKTKASRYWETDVERVTAMDDAVDGDLEFRLDPNQMWDVQDAVRVGASLEEAGIRLQYMEQPVRIDSIGTLKRLRERLTTPIAGGNEDLYVPRNLYYLVREDAIDVGQPDLVPAGGILAARREASVAAEANVPLAHHCGFDLGLKEAAKAHLMASTPAFKLAADSVYYALEDDILEEPLSIEDGRLEVPDRPGLAGPVDEEKVEQYRLD